MQTRVLPRALRRRIIAGMLAVGALIGSLGLATLPQVEPAQASGSKGLYPSAPGDNTCGMGGATQSANATTNHDTSVNYSNTSGPNSPCRYVIEWRSDSYGPDGTSIPRRSLFWVYAKAGDYILLGSSELQTNLGTSQANIDIWDPERTSAGGDIPNPILADVAPGAGGTAKPNLDDWTNQQLEATVDWRCTTGGTTEGGQQYTDYNGSATAGSRVGHTNYGIIANRSQENAGAYATDNTAGYTPCSFRAPHDGAYAVAFIGSAGPLSTTDMSPPGSGTETTASGSTNYFIPNPSGGFSPIANSNVTRSWDVTVRTNPNARSTDQSGRLFTYALAGWVGQPFYPLDVTYWLTTQDGFRYRVKTNGITPVGFLLYGNDEGFLNDDGSPLHHDVLATAGLGNTPSAMLNGLAGGTEFDAPLYPMSFDATNDGALSTDTLNYLHIPVQPQAPVLTGLTYTGDLGGNETYGGIGGTFYASTAGRGTLMIVISSGRKDANGNGVCTDSADMITATDTAYWDPTNPCNSTVYADVDGPHTGLAVPWHGNDNKGDAFVVGDDFPVLATLRGGEYHMPMIDLEGAVWGSPTFTMVNAPDVTGDGASDCPVFYSADYAQNAQGQVTSGKKVQSCSQAFFDDRGYRTALSGTSVGTLDNFICPANNQLGLEPSSQSNARAADNSLDASYSVSRYASDPLLGFNSDTERRVRAFGAAAASYGGTNWGVNNNVACANTRTTLGDAAGLELWTFYPSVTRKTGDPDFPAPDVTVKPQPLDAVADGPYTVPSSTSSQNGSQSLTANDTWSSADSALSCQIQTASGGWGSSGPIYASNGTTQVGTITLGNGGAYPCSYTYRIDGVSRYTEGIWTATYRLTDGTTADTATVTFVRGTFAVSDSAVASAGGGLISGDVRTNDLCVSGGTATVNWNQGDWVADPAQPYGTVIPANGTTSNADGSWSYLPNATFSGTVTRSYQTNRTTGCDNRIATLTITVVPVAVADDLTTSVDQPLSSDALSNDRGLGLVMTSVDTSGLPTGAELAWNADGTWTFTPPQGWSGVVTVPYGVSGDGGVSPLTTITIRVRPEAVDDTDVYARDAVTTGSVLTDDLGTGLTVTGVAAPSYGTSCPSCSLTIDGDGTYHFTAAPGYDATTTVTYTITDAAGQTDTAVLTLTTPPIEAVDDGYYQVPANGTWYLSTDVGVHPSAEAQLSWNDYYPSGATLTCEVATNAAGTAWGSAGRITDIYGNGIGDIELLAGGGPCDYRYRFDSTTPPGAYSAAYRISDGTNSATAAVRFARGTTAVDDAASTTTGGGALGGNVLANDACQAGGTPTVNWNQGDWAAAPAQSYGTVSPPNGAVLSADGSWIYTPNATFSGTLTRSYQTNRTTGCDDRIATVRITVVPVAAPDASSGNAGQPQSGNVTSNDAGRSTAGAAIDAVTGVDTSAAPAGFSMSSDGAWMFTPPTGWSGTFQVPYAAIGAGGTSAPTALTVTTLPQAVDDGATFAANQPASGNVLANDSGSGLTVTASGPAVCTQPADPCTVTIGLGGAYSFTPADGWVGTVSVPYTATDAAGNATSATLTLTGIAGIDAVDDGPYSVNNTTASQTGPATLRANDTPNNDPTVVCQLATGAAGSSQTWGSAGILYNSSGTSVGTITLNTSTTGEPCDYTFQFTSQLASPPGNGGYYATYRLCDSTTCDIAYASMYIGSVAVNDFAETTTGGAPLSGDVDANDTCTAGFLGSLSVSWNQGAWTALPPVAYGVVDPTTNSTGTTGAWSYTPNDTFSGTLYRDYQENASGWFGATCSNQVARLAINVRPVAENDAPDPVPAGSTVQTGNVLDNDHGRNAAGGQIDQATNVTCLDTSEVCSRFTMGGDGAWTFDPDDAWSGIVRVRYTATGAGGTSDPAYLTITVTPEAHDDAATGYAWDATHPAPPVTGNALANDLGGRAADGLQVIAHTGPAEGAFTLDAGGDYSYLSEQGWTGIAVIQYTIVDDDGQTSSATLTITIHARMTIELEKQGVGPSGEWGPMGGSSWQVYTDPGLTTPVPGGDLAPALTDTGGAYRWTIASLAGGTPLAGQHYWLVETQALSGFDLLAQAIEFYVADDAVVHIVTGGADSACAAASDATAVGPCVTTGATTASRIVVRDSTTVTLPRAGGNGTAGFTWAGAALLALAGGLGLAFLGLRRRRPGRHTRYQDLA